MTLLLQSIVTGIATGAVYSLIALGYNSIYSTTKVLNFAQGSFLMTGAMIGYTLFVTLKINFFLTFVLVAIAGAIIGVVCEKLIMIPHLRSGNTYTWILTTIAVSLILANLFTMIYGSDPFTVPRLVEGYFNIGPAIISKQQVLILFASLCIMFAYMAFSKYTFYGQAIRATSFNRDVASLVGIPVPLIISISFMLSGAIAAVGGFLASPVLFAYSTMGMVVGTKGYISLVLGGMGSEKGAVVGGLCVGIIDVTCKNMLPSEIGTVAIYLLLAVILLCKPTGIFGVKN